MKYEVLSPDELRTIMEDALSSGLLVTQGESQMSEAQAAKDLEKILSQTEAAEEAYIAKECDGRFRAVVFHCLTFSQMKDKEATCVASGKLAPVSKPMSKGEAITKIKAFNLTGISKYLVKDGDEYRTFFHF